MRVTLRKRPPVTTDFAILMCLLRGEAHGYAIGQTVARLTDGLMYPGPSSLYPGLQRLLSDNLIESADVSVTDGGRTRKVYRITDAGRARAQEMRQAVVAMVNISPVL